MPPGEEYCDQQCPDSDYHLKRDFEVVDPDEVLAKVAALQITPVHYLFKPTEEMMYKHFDRVAAATGVPVMIYNVVPWCYLSPELLTKIITEVDGVIGVKQSAGDLNLLANLMLQLGDRGLVMAATDALLYSAYSLGAHGSIAAILPAAPKLRATSMV